jgi:hypothetical protein
VVLVVAETSQKARERSSLRLIAGDARFEIGREGYYHLNRSDASTVEMRIYHGAVQLTEARLARERV